MKKYIGVKLISAENESRDGEKGYKVVYPDGYESWSPKGVFEKAYVPISKNQNLPSEISIGQDMVDDFIKEVEIMTIGNKSTVVRAVLKNGFEIIESSACVDEKNYSEEIGAEICLDKIKDKIWMLLGFLLQCGFNGFD